MNRLFYFALPWVLLGLSSTVCAYELGAMVSSQSSYGTRQNQWPQHDLLADFEFNDSIGKGELTLITRLRYGEKPDYNHIETPNNYSDWSKPLWINDKGELSIRELYWDINTNQTSWRIGKQQVVWGKADGLKLLDVVNPQSFRQFILDDFDDSRIPIWMVNWQWFMGNNSTLQLLWIPDTTAHEIPPQHSPFAFTSPVVVPQASGSIPVSVNELELPENLPKDSDAGIRLTSFIYGWDISVNYLYHYVDFPVLRTELENQQVTIYQSLERSHLIGTSASTAINDWTLRTELAFESDRYFRTYTAIPGVEQQDQISGLIGFDWQGWRDQYVSIQWFHKTILNASNNLIEDSQSNTITLLWDSYFFNETLKLQWLHIHSINNEDGVLQPKAIYNLQSNLDIFIGADYFYGDDDQLYGEFDKANRISLGFELGI